MWLLEDKSINQRIASFGPVFLANEKEIRRRMDEIQLNEYYEWQ